MWQSSLSVSVLFSIPKHFNEKRNIYDPLVSSIYHQVDKMLCYNNNNKNKNICFLILLWYREKRGKHKREKNLTALLFCFFLLLSFLVVCYQRKCIFRYIHIFHFKLKWMMHWIGEAITCYKLAKVKVKLNCNGKLWLWLWL